jgi:uncharacterized Fe-S cluster-containing radical SAM superfamily protein
VRSRAEIEATLDASGALNGCLFMPQMYDQCGRTLRVDGLVERFFDERRWRMLRCHQLVRLEGIFCDGTVTADTRGCDRRCFCFWRTEWLEPAE